MHRSLTISLGLHAGLLGAAVWLLGEQPEPPQAQVGMLIVRQPRPEPEPIAAPPLEAPVRPPDPVEPLDPDPAPPPELEPVVVLEPVMAVWRPPAYARLTQVVRAAKQVAKAAQPPLRRATPKPTSPRKRAALARLVRAKPAKGRCAPVRYPPRARHLGLEGKVLLRVRIAADGSPAKVVVLESSGHRSLDRAARDAVARWQFIPATRAGRPVAQWLRLPIEFRLRRLG